MAKSLGRSVFIGTATAVFGPLQFLSGIAVPILCTNSAAHQLANFGIVVLIKIISYMKNVKKNCVTEKRPPLTILI